MAVGDYKTYTNARGEHIRVRVVREGEEMVAVKSAKSNYMVRPDQLSDDVIENVPEGAQTVDASGASEENQPAPPLTTNQTAGETPAGADVPVANSERTQRNTA